MPRHDLPPHQAHRQGDGLRDGGFQVLRVRPEGGRNQGGGGQYWVLSVTIVYFISYDLLPI